MATRREKLIVAGVATTTLLLGLYLLSREASYPLYGEDTGDAPPPSSSGGAGAPGGWSAPPPAAEPADTADEAPQEPLRCALPEEVTDAWLVLILPDRPIRIPLEINDHAVRLPEVATSLAETLWIEASGIGIFFPTLAADETCRIDRFIETRPPTSTIRCPLRLLGDVDASFRIEPSADRLARLTAAAKGAGPPPVVYETSAYVDETHLVIEGGPSGQGVLWVDGDSNSLSREVRWSSGRCEPPALESPARVYGEIGPLLGALFARVEVCGEQLTLDHGRSQYELLVWAGPCEATAWRQDGNLRTFGEVVDLSLAPGEEREVDLTLPAERSAAIGVNIQEAEGGFVLAYVNPEGPAAAAGLVQGDLIVAVNGEVAEELSTEGFARLSMGPVGTEVVMTVRSEDGSEREVTVARTLIY